MDKTRIASLPAGFGTYIREAGSGELLDELRAGSDWTALVDGAVLARRQDHAYAPGKWTAKGVIQHLMDAERVFAYRALRFARQDPTPLPGFDENLFGLTAAPGRRGLDDVLGEWTALRRSTIALFASFDEAMLLRRGICAGTGIDVLSLGFTIVGHQAHHLRVLRELYLGG
jgi:hypothetical protein